METPNDPQPEFELRLEKLRLEIEEMKRNGRWNRRLGRYLPVLSAVLPALALTFAIVQFSRQEDANRQARERQSKADVLAAERAFMQPVIARQMTTYFEASAAAATIASSQDTEEQSKARDVFYRLYWGPLVMLESPQVSGAMKAFKECLDAPDSCTADRVRHRSLILASSLQTDLFESWKLSPAEYAQRSINYARDRDTSVAASPTSPTSPTSENSRVPMSRINESRRRRTGRTSKARDVSVDDSKRTKPVIVEPDSKVPDSKVPNSKAPD